MATTFEDAGAAGTRSALMRRDRCISSPWFDALFFWGQPALAFVLTGLWFVAADQVPDRAGHLMVSGFVAFVAILTYAHLIAVAPRAYLNRDVFARFPRRLVLAPLLLVLAFALSSTLLVAGMVLTVFWDVHHSAMQTFGLSRIYDMKAGNDPLALRGVDMVLNWALYVGPIVAGASMLVHVHALDAFSLLDWSLLTELPAAADGLAWSIRLAGVGAWLLVLGWAAWRYRLAARRGYRIPPHKQALLGVTGTVSIAAWGFAPPLVAFAAINLFHAVQYFALVWLKEGKRIGGAMPPALRRNAAPWFVATCMGFGLLYWAAMQAGEASARWYLAPFIACSLLHFWYDGFVWSVRARQV